MFKASCLCGSITISIEGKLEHEPEACHCVQCRKHTGHFITGVNVRKTALTIQGEEYVKWYRSSDKVERGFCATCGSTLFWKPIIPGYEWVSVVLGLFDEPIGKKLAKHTFVSEKGDYYDLNDGVAQYEKF